jgi:hypothetical protein
MLVTKNNKTFNKSGGLGGLFSNPTHNRYNVIKVTSLLAPRTGAGDIVQTEPANH